MSVCVCAGLLEVPSLSLSLSLSAFGSRAVPAPSFGIQYSGKKKKEMSKDGSA